MVKKIVEELKKKGYNIKLASEIKQCEKIKTGIFLLDYIMDGGIYWGEGGHRIEFYGKESSGKTTFALYIVKRFQELKKKCVYVNAEQSYDKTWAEIIGVDNNKLYIADPDSLEQAGDMLCDFLGEYDLIIIDSIPSLIPKEELEGTLEENKYMASQAKVMSPLMRKLYSATKDNFTVIIFINQLREKVGLMYGNPIDTPGGRALKHAYNTRVEFRLGKPIEEGTKEDKHKIGYEINLNCTKNKRGKPYRTGILDFYLDGTINNKKSLIYSAVKYGIIEQNASYYIYKNIKEQGLDIFSKIISDKEYQDIEKELWKYIK